MLTQSNFIRACLFGGAILVLTTVLEAQSKSNIEFRPKIPKAWDDAEVTAMEIPLADPAPPVTNISASYYYSIPPVTIYKTYPFLSSEPFAEYWKWLKQREPEVAFDPAKLKTKADWEKFGEFFVLSVTSSGLLCSPKASSGRCGQRARLRLCCVRRPRCSRVGHSREGQSRDDCARP